jgi:hypothetical protein
MKTTQFSMINKFINPIGRPPPGQKLKKKNRAGATTIRGVPVWE